MIGGPLAPARREVDGAAGAALGERRREQCEIDAQAPVALEGAQPIVPPRKLFYVAVLLAKQIDKSPLLYIMDRRPLRSRKSGVVSRRSSAVMRRSRHTNSAL